MSRVFSSVPGAKKYLLFVCAAILLSATGSQAISLNYIGAGPRLGLVIAEDVGAGFNLGGHMLFGLDMGQAGALHIYPNIDFWFGHEEYWHDRPPNPDYNVDLWAFELTINFDARYYFALPSSVPIAPYAGLGFCPVVTIYEWDPSWWDGWDHDHTEVGPGFNMLGGLDIPLGSNKLFFEFRGKVGSDYELIKLLAGLSFTIR